jgi:hypothetical protein
MDRKRPQPFDDDDDIYASTESPTKKQNTFKVPTPPQKQDQSKLPFGTPTVATRYGIDNSDASSDASSLVDWIDTFATLVKCVAHVVDNCGGSYEEDRNLGAYLIDAVNAVTVCPPSTCAHY